MFKSRAHENYLVPRKRREKELKKRKALLIVFALLISTLTFSPKAAFSQETPAVSVNPPLVEDLLPSETFTINVTVANVTGLYGLDIRLSWDPAILGYVSHQAKIPVETHPEGILYNTVLMIRDDIDSVAGTYWVAASSLSPAPTFNGTGMVVEITFQVNDIGQTPIQIYSSALSDQNAMAIPHNVQHGFFTNYSPVSVPVYVDPGQVVDSGLIPCNNFTVDINIDGINKLAEFEFWLEYNTTLLDVVNIEVNPVFTTSGTGIFELDGQVQVNGTTLSFAGDITLASITFHVMETGETPLDLHNVTLIDEYSDPLPYNEPEDGFFSNILKAKLWVEPDEIIDPLLTPGSEFSVDIMVTDVFNLYGYNFNLSYDTFVLTCIGATITPISNETNFTTEIIMVDGNGFIFINVSYYAPAAPMTLMAPTKIATNYFQFQNYGCTVLDLHDTELTNESGGPITHETEDGFFCTLIADVAIVNIELSSNMTYSGRVVNVTVTAANLGDTTETFNVTAYYDSIPIGTQTVTDLMPSQNAILIFGWDTTGLEECTNYTISAEASPVDYELDLGNNMLSADVAVKIKILGDVNGDGIVDIFDIVLTAAAYQSTTGDPEWNSEADVAPLFGLIDIFDIVTVASRWGQTCNP
jgi:hypothetical protein